MDQRDIDYIVEAHRDHAKKNKSCRKWDQKTPYYIHPLWCATTIAMETTLPESVRNEGVQVLLYHDILEDTTQDLPNWLSTRVRELINEMTFTGGSAEEMKHIWNKPSEIRLYKLYDKVSNLLDGTWMDEKKRLTYTRYARSLVEDVEKNYEKLNITNIAFRLSVQCQT